VGGMGIACFLRHSGRLSALPEAMRSLGGSCGKPQHRLDDPDGWYALVKVLPRTFSVNSQTGYRVLPDVG